MNKEKIDLSKPKKEYEKFQKESESLVDELKIDEKAQEEEILSEEIEASFWGDLYRQILEKIKNDEGLKNRIVDRFNQDIKEDKVSNIKNFLFCKEIGICKEEIEKGLKDLKNNESFKNKNMNILDTLNKEIDEHQKKNKNYKADPFYLFLALKNILFQKKININKNKVDKRLKDIKDNDEYQNIMIDYLDKKIEKAKKNNNGYAFVALEVLSVLDSLNIYKKEVAKHLELIKDDSSFKKMAINDIDRTVDNALSAGNYDVYNLFIILSSIENVSKYWQNIVEDKKAIEARDDNKAESISKRPEIR